MALKVKRVIQIQCKAIEFFRLARIFFLSLSGSEYFFQSIMSQNFFSQATVGQNIFVYTIQIWKPTL